MTIPCCEVSFFANCTPWASCWRTSWYAILFLINFLNQYAEEKYRVLDNSIFKALNLTFVYRFLYFSTMLLSALKFQLRDFDDLCNGVKKKECTIIRKFLQFRKILRFHNFSRKIAFLDRKNSKIPWVLQIDFSFSNPKKLGSEKALLFASILKNLH